MDWLTLVSNPSFRQVGFRVTLRALEARRTATYDPLSAWNALSLCKNPLDILSSTTSSPAYRLHEARREVRVETDRCSRGPGTGPVFSGDGKIALVRIKSGASIHPVSLSSLLATSVPYFLSMFAGYSNTMGQYSQVIETQGCHVRQ